MSFKHGPHLTAEIKSLVQTRSSLKIAIAYWGDQALSLLHLKPTRANLEIVCCLKGGKSSPAVVRRFGSQARQDDLLHAKVIWTPERAIVGSANASSNGLPEEEDRAGRLIEAGYVVTDSDSLSKIETWFDDLYRKSRDISPDDLRDAELARRQRGQNNRAPELLDIPLNQLVSAELGVFLWSGYTTKKEDEEVMQMEAAFAKIETADWYVDSLSHARRYPYGYHTICFEVSSSMSLRLRPHFQRFPPQNEWHKLSSGNYVIFAETVPKKVPGLPKFRLGKKSLTEIRERLIARDLRLHHHLASRSIEDGWVSWESLHTLLSA
jgi:hypothetical protein